ncbi:MAG: methyltransferase family protein [Dongiaceae bacterium]
MSETPADNPGVIAPPPILFAACILAGVLIDLAWPMALLADDWQYWIGGILMAAGLALAVTCIAMFGRAGTNVPTYRPTTALVIDGPYRWSRNPIYIALFLAYAGIGAVADNGWMLALALPLFVVMNIGVIAREERYLERKFGSAYLAYKSRARRWL